MAIFGVRKAIKKNIKSLMGLDASKQSTVPSWTPPEPQRARVEPPQPEEVQVAPEPVSAPEEIEMPKDEVVLQEPLTIHTEDEGQPLTLENVEEVIDDFIRPGVQADGGNIELLKIENSDVYVKLTGACQSCSSAIMTMKMGVEALLREEFPSMRQLIDETVYAA